MVLGSSLPGARLRKVRNAADEYRKMLEGIIAQGIKKKQFKKMNPKLVSLALLGVCNWMVFWYSKRGPIKLDEITESFSAVFLDGLRASRR